MLFYFRFGISKVLSAALNLFSLKPVGRVCVSVGDEYFSNLALTTFLIKSTSIWCVPKAMCTGDGCVPLCCLWEGQWVEGVLWKWTYDFLKLIRILSPLGIEEVRTWRHGQFVHLIVKAPENLQLELKFIKLQDFLRIWEINLNWESPEGAAFSRRWIVLVDKYWKVL